MPISVPPIPARPSSRFVRACLRLPVDRTPVWFLRQAGRYMPEYMAVRKHHSLLDICRTPAIAAEVTITAAERLGVDAAIIFADLLLPFTPMGLDFEFVAGEGPIVHTPVRSLEAVQALRTDRVDELSYVAEAIQRVSAHFAPSGHGFSSDAISTDQRAPEGQASSGPGFSSDAISTDQRAPTGQASSGHGFSRDVTAPGSDGASAPEGSPSGPQQPMDQLGIIGFCGAPFTLASYMIEGASSRNYIETKRLMYASGRDPANAPSSEPRALGTGPTLAWPLLMAKLVEVLAAFALQQVQAGADVIQVFDSWAGALSPTDFRAYVLGPTTELIQRIRAFGVPVIYFGVDTATLLPAMRETGADVLGLDWRIPLDEGWRLAGPGCAVQGNLDPITLFAPAEVLEARVYEILTLANGRPGHIFNLGHGIVPGTPVESVLQVVDTVKRFALPGATRARPEAAGAWAIRA